MSFLGGLGISLAGGLVNGLFGRNQNKDLNRLSHFQMQIAQQLRDFGNSPGMNIQEQGAFANQRAELGEQQRGDAEQLQAQYSRNNQGNVGDFLTNLNGQQRGAQMALEAQHVMAALQSRRQSLLQASQVGQTAANTASQAQAAQGDSLASLFGQVAQMLAFQQANKQQPAAGAGNQGVAYRPGTVAGMRGSQHGGTMGDFGTAQPVPNGYTPGIFG